MERTKANRGGGRGAEEKALTASLHGSESKKKAKGRGLKTVSNQGKKPPSLPPRSFIGRRASSPERTPRLALTAGNLSIASSGRAPPRPQRRCGRVIITAKTGSNRGKTVTSACRAAHYARARTAAAPKKARPYCKTAATTARHLNAQAPCQARSTLERGEPPARSKGDPRWDISVRRPPGTFSV
jgi:hypothetical protein